MIGAGAAGVARVPVATRKASRRSLRRTLGCFRRDGDAQGLQAPSPCGAARNDGRPSAAEENATRRG